MLEWLKSLWAKWKVQISFVGGALVVATAYGQCTVEPSEDSAGEVVEESVENTAIDSESTSTNVANTVVETNVENTSADQEKTNEDTIESTD
jgi:hypothetical protein